jgi:NADPH:quinone reductase-like Zn-dependent oxidoreductase
MPRIRVLEKASSLDDLHPLVEADVQPQALPDHVVVEVRAAGVNPSDVKAALGMMPHAVWPRTPGRDWAGVVVDGPSDLMGKSVWGSGGDLGITRDGTHAKYLQAPRTYVREMPPGVSFEEAGAIGVPFVTAFEGFTRAGMPKPGEFVLVFGANGKVGQAACQIAAMHGATVIGVERVRQTHQSHAPVAMIGASEDIAAEVHRLTDGHGADIVFNTVGSPYFAAANASLAVGGRAIFIATIDREVPFDILSFYRGRHTYVGIDTLALDGAASAQNLDALAAGFAAGHLRPYPVPEHARYPIARAAAAYRAVLSGSTDRVVLLPCT